MTLGARPEPPFADGVRQLDPPAVRKERQTFLFSPPVCLCSIYVFNCSEFGSGPLCVWWNNRNTWTTYKTAASACCVDRQQGVLGKQFEDGRNIVSDTKRPKGLKTFYILNIRGLLILDPVLVVDFLSAAQHAAVYALYVYVKRGWIVNSKVKSDLLSVY